MLVSVTQIYVRTIYFILKQGYMFRLEVSHLQAPTTFLLPDVLPSLGSHSVYIRGIHLSLNFLKSPHSGHNTVNKNSIGQIIETVSKPRRSYSHPRCSTSPTTGMKKITADKNNEIHVSLSDNLTSRITLTSSRNI